MAKRTVWFGQWYRRGGPGIRSRSSIYSWRNLHTGEVIKGGKTEPNLGQRKTPTGYEITRKHSYGPQVIKHRDMPIDYKEKGRKKRAKLTYTI